MGFRDLMTPSFTYHRSGGSGLLGPGPPARPLDVSPVYRIKDM